jgi:hypothetical protein
MPSNLRFPTPASSPAVWTVQIQPMIGAQSYMLVGLDGEGYPRYMSGLPIPETFEGERESEIAHIQGKLDILRKREEKVSRPVLAFPRSLGSR